MDQWGPAGSHSSPASQCGEAPEEGVYALGNLLGLAMLGPSGAMSLGLELVSVTQALVRHLDVAAGLVHRCLAMDMLPSV